MAGWQLCLLALIGCLAGYLNVLAGGGSLLTVPVMLFLGLPGPVANGTNRIAILAQNITAVAAFRHKGYSDFRLSLTLALCALPGAVAGALLGTRLEGIWFNRVLALIMVAVMLLMATERARPAGAKGVPVGRGRLLLGHLLMVAVGCYGGFIQIGVGFLFMPVLYRVLGMDLVTANMHKVFITGVYTVAALMVFAAQVQLLWLPGLGLALGYSLGAWIGAHMAVTRGDRYIRLVLNLVLAAFIIRLLFLS